jgi:hypothetical protein
VRVEHANLSGGEHLHTIWFDVFSYVTHSRLTHDIVSPAITAQPVRLDYVSSLQTGGTRTLTPFWERTFCLLHRKQFSTICPEVKCKTMTTKPRITIGIAGVGCVLFFVCCMHVGCLFGPPKRHSATYPTHNYSCPSRTTQQTTRRGPGPGRRH